MVHEWKDLLLGKPALAVKVHQLKDLLQRHQLNLRHEVLPLAASVLGDLLDEPLLGLVLLDLRGGWTRGAR